MTVNAASKGNFAGKVRWRTSWKMGYRNSGFDYKDNNVKILLNNIGDGKGAKDGIDLTAKEITTAYQVIETRIKEYLKRPTNTELRAEEEQTDAQMNPVVVPVEMPNPTNPDGTQLEEMAWNTIKAEIESVTFGTDKAQNKQLAAVTGNDFYCYATANPKDQKLITGTSFVTLPNAPLMDIRGS